LQTSWVLGSENISRCKSHDYCLLTVRNFLEQITCYPPAEAKLSLRHVILSLFSRSGDFEKSLCTYLGVNQCVLANSGRALLYLLLKKLQDQEGKDRDQVLIPGYTCYSVAASIAKAGLEIRVYDLDPKTFGADIDDIKRKVNPHTLAIVCQHLFGIPTDLGELVPLAREEKCYLIEDAAQALGGYMGSMPLGRLADFGFYSFGRGKPLPLGCGGALIGKDSRILSSLSISKLANSFTALVKVAGGQVFSSPHMYWLPEALPLGLGETVFDPGFPALGIPRKIRTLGEKALSLLAVLNSHRKKIARTYLEVLDKHNCVTSHDGVPVYTRFPVIASEVPISKELKRLGVRRMYPRAIIDELEIRPYLTKAETPTPGAAEIARRLITLPTHMGITENLAHEIATKVKKHFGL